MMKCHPIMHSLCCLGWIITSVTCILIGISAFNVDIYAWPLLNNDQFMMIAKYIIGVAGVLSLLKMLMWNSHCECQNNHHQHHAQR